MYRRKFLQFSILATLVPFSIIPRKSKARKLAEEMMKSFQSSKSFKKNHPYIIEVFDDASVHRAKLHSLYCLSVPFYKKPAGSITWNMSDNITHMEVCDEFKKLCDQNNYQCTIRLDVNTAFSRKYNTKA